MKLTRVERTKDGVVGLIGGKKETAWLRYTLQTIAEKVDKELEENAKARHPEITKWGISK